MLLNFSHYSPRQFLKMGGDLDTVTSSSLGSPSACESETQRCEHHAQRRATARGLQGPWDAAR